MITIQYMKPFYTKVTGTKVRLTFAHQYLAIMKDDEIYQFIPLEGKEIIANLKTGLVENLSEVFVFQRGNRYIRFPLCRLILMSNITEHLMPVIGGLKTEEVESELINGEIEGEIDTIIFESEKMFLETEIDRALAARDEAKFYELSKALIALEGGA